VTLVRRVILDIGIEDVVKLYVELFADKATFKVPMPEFGKVEIMRTDGRVLPWRENPPEPVGKRPEPTPRPPDAKPPAT